MDAPARVIQEEGDKGVCCFCRKKKNCGKGSVFPPESSRYAPLVLAHEGLAIPWLIYDRAALHPCQIFCITTQQYMHQHACACCCSLPGFSRYVNAPCLSCATTSLRAHWSSEEAHLVNTILNQPNLRRVSADLLNRDDNSWLYLLRVSPPLHPPERLSHTRAPKPGFGGKMHVCMLVCIYG